MERCVPQGFVSAQTAAHPQVGQGIFVGKMPGSSNAPPYNDAAVNAGYSGADRLTTNAGITIQTDGGFISTMSAQPQNVLRITGASGAGYIQGENIRFSMPFSGAAGAAILPGSGTMNIANLAFVSTIATGVGRINMSQLTSTIVGNNWAQVL